MRLAATLSLLLATLGCERDGAPRAPASDGSPARVTQAAPLTPDAPLGRLDEALIARGRARVEHFQCHRCHDGTDLPSPPQEKHCVHCHQAILANTFEAPEPVLAKWRAHLTHLLELPTLSHAGARFERSWMIRYLQEPHDLRPRLPEQMPRLAISPEDAEAIAAHLMPQQHAPQDAARVALEGDAARGERLIQDKGCMSCHSFTGAKPLQAQPLPVTLSPEALARGMKLATDLRLARERVRPGALAPWIKDPRALKPDTTMPTLPMTDQDARDLATFILTTPLAPLAPAPPIERLPLLERPVAWAEVEREVFRFICWHCHSEGDYVGGDGGPGNTGGFGFAPRKLSLSDYSAVSRGLLDAQGKRVSAFTPDEQGVPLLVRAMMARHHEVAGRPVPGLRGMPLGLPPMSLEKIQLVESWIAQGRPR